MPLEHVPEQQSASARQPRPAARHTHVPPEQSMYPQQSPPLAQLSPASTQQRTPNDTPRRHESAPQHSASLVQLPCTVEHAHDVAP